MGRSSEARGSSTMKLLGFRIHKPWPRVEVWEWREFRLHLHYVLENCLVSALPRPIRTAGADFAEFDLFWLAARMGPLAFRMPNGTRRRLPLGQIVTTSICDCMDFLTTAYVPQGGRHVDLVLGRAARGDLPRAALLHELDVLFWDAPATLTPGDQDGDKVVLIAPDEFPILWHDPEAGEDVAAIRIDGMRGEALLAQGESQILTCDIDSTVGGRPVPRAAWVPIEPDEKTPSDYWDGHCTRPASSWESVDAGLRHNLEGKGTSLRDVVDHAYSGERPPTFDGEIEPRFLLRVPPTALLDGAAEKRPDQRELRCAAVLVDSRCPVPLPDRGRGIPFVDDPGVARFVLSRTTADGVYVPAAPALSQPARFSPGSVLIGTLPKAVAPSKDRFCPDPPV
jgi:hypothetical protein